MLADVRLRLIRPLWFYLILDTARPGMPGRDADRGRGWTGHARGVERVVDWKRRGRASLRPTGLFRSGYVSPAEIFRRQAHFLSLFTDFLDKLGTSLSVIEKERYHLKSADQRPAQQAASNTEDQRPWPDRLHA